jgi:hypothetical protein
MLAGLGRTCPRSRHNRLRRGRLYRVPIHVGGPGRRATRGVGPHEGRLVTRLHRACTSTPPTEDVAPMDRNKPRATDRSRWIDLIGIGLCVLLAAAVVQRTEIDTLGGFIRFVLGFGIGWGAAWGTHRYKSTPRAALFAGIGVALMVVCVLWFSFVIGAGIATAILTRRLRPDETESRSSDRVPP